MRTMLMIMLFLLNIGNLLYIWDVWRRGLGRTYSYRGHDFPIHLPIPSGLPQVLMTTEGSVHYPLNGWASDAEWTSLAGTKPKKSWGYVRLGPNERIFVVGMYHELHCLRILNLAFDESGSAVSEGHIKHCLGYLRQMALCSADLTLERAGWEKKDFEVDREGATHVCNDWGKVSEIVEDNFETWLDARGSSS